MRPTGKPSRLLSAAILSTLFASGAFAQQRTFDLPEQEAIKSIPEFARQAGIQISAPTEELKGMRTPRIQGEMDVRAALQRLIEGTGLEVASDEGGMVVLRKSLRTAQAPVPSQGKPGGDIGSAGEAIQDSLKVPERQTLEEIIVTAQKRSERLQDVPVPVTALDAVSLIRTNQLRLDTYYTRIPGLNLTILGDAGGPALSIRGMTTGGFINPTVAIVVDDVPFGASTVANNGNLTIAPDFDPSELERVEVLRGPQGTLYGASSLGGLVKYVTVDPSMERKSGSVRAGVSTVDGGELGYSVRGTANVPISDTFAVRFSGSSRRDPGYVDNLQTGQNDVNRVDAVGGRISSLWRPTEALSIKLSALYQRAQQDGSSEVHLPSAITGPATLVSSGRPDLGDLQQTALINSGTYDRKLQAYSATVQASFGSAELTVLSGYGVSEYDTAGDVTPFLGDITLNGAPALGFPGFGVRGAVQNLYPKTTKFSQEIRFATPLGSRIEWRIGAFYTDEDYESATDILAINPANGAVAGNWWRSDSTGSYEEYAAFTDLTLQITDRLDVQVGARQSHNKMAYAATSSGLFNTVLVGTTFQSDTPRTEADDDSFTYLLTPRFKISPDLMAYARIASGYRPGGSNTTPTARAAGLPFEYDHDTSENYEVGVKGTTPGGVFSLDASVYYIDWKDIQLQLRDPTINLTYTFNAGGARSRGAELSFTLRPISGMRLSGWAAFNEAELTEVPPTSTLAARPGDRLPYSPRWSGNLAVDQEFPIWGGAEAFVGASVSYVGDRKGRFFSQGVQGTFPSYVQTDIHAGVRIDTWALDTFVNNVTDKRGVLRGGRDSNLSRLYALDYILPRSYGVSLTKSF